MTIDDEKDILDNPEWSAEDIRKGARLEQIAPELAANIRRDLHSVGRPAVRLSSPKSEKKPKNVRG